MRKRTSALAVFVEPDDTIDVVIRRMARESRDVEHAGLAVVLDPNQVVQGVLTDGDIRRAYARDVSWHDPVSKIMIREPVTLPVGIKEDQIIPQLAERVERAKHLKAKTIKHILLVNEANHLVEIRDFAELLWDREDRSARVHVIGLGFVGLTVAISLANVGHRVVGVDIDPNLVGKLRSGVSPIFEAGLTPKLRHAVERGAISFDETLQRSGSGIYIIAVGAPVAQRGGADLSAIEAVAGQLGRILKHGDQVILRSTVPVGVTNRRLAPLLEEGSGLDVGEDLNVAFCPERTLAGRAMPELQMLPQLVGGVTPRCTEKAARFWSTLTHSVVRVPSAEVAELAKLANNSFRNTSFAFANELALLAEEHNIDVSEVINAANNGYPRNPIPTASPGVGGYCLPKDSMFLSTSFTEPRSNSHLSSIACDVNRKSSEFPIRVFDKFCKRVNLSPTKVNALVIGMAFKGEPETNDLRGSTGLKVAKALIQKGVCVRVWDSIVSREELTAQGLIYADNLATVVERADCIFVMNNHRENTSIEIARDPAIRSAKLLFDGWKLFDRQVVESMAGMLYSAPGYLTES